MKTPNDDRATLTHRKHAKPSRAVIQCMNLLDISYDQWISEMEETQVEIARVRKLNALEIAENRKIIAENRVREIKKLRLLKLLPRPHKIAQWAQDRLDRETEIKRGLKKRSPQAWKSQIAALSGATRNRVACLVWWDFFGGQTVKHRWPHLDQWVNAPYEAAPVENVIDGLHKVGYSPWEAKKRATKEKDDE